MSEETILIDANDASTDPVIALDAAVRLMAGKPFDSLLCGGLPVAEAGSRVTALADVFVRWLRRPVRIRFSTPVISEQETGDTVFTAGGTTMATDAALDTSQVATWDVDPEDDRGFDVDLALDVVVAPEGVVTAVYQPRAAAGEPAKLVATAVAPGSALITLTDPVSGVSGAVSATVVAGGAAVISFGDPVITEQV